MWLCKDINTAWKQALIIDGWYETKQPSAPPSERRHDLSDAFAIVRTGDGSLCGVHIPCVPEVPT